MKNTLFLNIFFIIICVFFIILSFLIDYFFFIPIICFIPFTFKTKYKSKIVHEEIEREGNFFDKTKNEELKLVKCPYCGVDILDPLARYCSQCGKKL
jgi:hypothetical protein